MKYKLIAMDIDDTLLNKNKVITPKTKTALLKAQSLGIKLVIASGRLPYGVRPFAKELNITGNDGYYMGFNGGAIFDSNENLISSTFLDSKYIKPVYEILRPTNITTIVHRGDTLFADRKVNRYTNTETKVVGLELNLVDDIEKYVDWKIPKILMAGELEELKIVRQKLTQRLENQVDIYFSAPFFLEVMPKTISKGIGLEKICAHSNISLSETIAIGDNLNDMSMIKAAGLGVAMANGQPQLKEQADYVTENDCNSDGIAEVIGKFIFNN